ncbi:MAG: hypothetical protein JOZ73_09660, partial [Solirubrobacterales bacterium]|nr:hypothetical protein [Solirubrobacterales bacterium]
CTTNPQPSVNPSLIGDPNLVQDLQNVYYTKTPGGPSCKGQAPLGETTIGQLQAFPELTPLP